MKQEVYSCMRMLDELKNSLINLHNIGSCGATYSFIRQYSEICNVLKSNLSDEQFKMVQLIPKDNSDGIPVDINYSNRCDMEELIIAVTLTVTYLHSLEMSLDKELIKKKIEISKKEKELEIQQKELDSFKKIFKDSTEAIKQFPEMIRSQVVAEIKKNHREIEANTNSKTRSQNN